MTKYHEIKKVKISEENLSLTIDGKDYSFNLQKNSMKLFGANELERNTFEISTSGYGIHWPLVDEDISIDGLLGISHKPIFDLKDVI